jgi:hypothetical protein
MSRSSNNVIVSLVSLAGILIFAALSATAQQTTAPPATNSAPATNPPSTLSNTTTDSEKNTGKQDSSPSGAQPAHSAEESIPTTTVFPEPKQQIFLAPELAHPQLPKEKISLIGGVVENIDQVRNHMTLQIFGAKKMKIRFDERTKFDRNGVDANQLAVKTGDRVYVDTQLDQGKIFARNVHVRTAAGVAAASGQVIAYNPKTGTVSMRDMISKRPVSFRVTQSTVIKDKNANGATVALQPNALISVRLTPAGGQSVANEIDVLAMPGSEFTFYGTLTHLDLRSGMMAVENKSDGKLYEIRFSPAQVGVTDSLSIGADVTVLAAFNGENYTAKSVKVNQAASSAAPSEVPKQ